MKKFTLLLSAFSVAMAANAVSPEVNANLPKPAYAFGNLVKNEAQFVKLTNEKVKINKTGIKKAGEAEQFSVCYEVPAGTMAAGLSMERSSLLTNRRLGPAYAPVTWVNTSTGATEFEWEYPGPNATEDDPDYQYSNEVDFTYTYPYTYTDAPTLYAEGANGENDSYSANHEGLFYQFGGGLTVDAVDEDENVETKDFGVMTDLWTPIMDDAKYYTIGLMMYDSTDDEMDPNNGLESVWADTGDGGVGLVGCQFAGYAATFPAPSAPYSMTKLWGWFSYNMKRATSLELTLYKIDEDGALTEEILAQGTTKLKRSIGDKDEMIEFELYTVDEDGVETDDPIVVDCGFIAVLSVNKDDFNSFATVFGGGCIFPADDRSKDIYPTRAYLALDVDGEVGYYGCPYYYYADDEHTQLFDVANMTWMIDAKYTWMLPAEGSSLTQVAPAEGGEVSFTVNSYYNLLYFIQNDMCYTNEADAIELTDYVEDEETYLQTLTVQVEALPEGVEGREIYIEFDNTVFSGCPNILTIQQGEVDAVNTISVSGDVKYFDLAGRQVANPEKGLYIKVEGNKAQKVIL